jgi:hypothetical protein
MGFDVVRRHAVAAVGRDEECRLRTRVSISSRQFITSDDGSLEHSTPDEADRPFGPLSDM